MIAQPRPNLTAERAAQGHPAKVIAPDVLAKVATILKKAS